VRIYCGLASAGQRLCVAIVDDAGRLLVSHEIDDDATGYAAVCSLITERSGGASTGQTMVVAENDSHLVPLLLAASGRPFALGDANVVAAFSRDLTNAPDPVRRAAALARALHAGILRTDDPSTAWHAGLDILALAPLLSAHAAVIAGRVTLVAALRGVLRELYPAALRAFPDPGDPTALALLEALPDPVMVARGQEGDVVTQLTAAGYRDVEPALLALRQAVAETIPRREITDPIGPAVRHAVVAVRSCDRSANSLLESISERLERRAGSAAPAAAPAPPAAGPAAPLPPISVPPLPQPVSSPAAGGPLGTNSYPNAAGYAVGSAPPSPAYPSPVASPGSAGSGGHPQAVPSGHSTGSPQVVGPPSTPAANSGGWGSAGAAPVDPAARTQQQYPPAPKRAEVAELPDDSDLSLSLLTPDELPTSSNLRGTAPRNRDADGTRESGSQRPAPAAPEKSEPVEAPQQPERQQAEEEPVRRSRAARHHSPDTGVSPQQHDPEPSVAAAERSGAHQRVSPAGEERGGVIEFPAARRRRARHDSESDSGDQPAAAAREVPPGDLSYGEPKPPASLEELTRPPSFGLDTGPESRPAPSETADTAPAQRRRSASVSPTRPAVDDADSDLLIFAQASAWFDGERRSSNSDWSSPADTGWRAAEAIRQPSIGGTTRSGLPRRVPQANLVPGTASPDPERERQQRIVRDPDQLAANTAGYFRGWSRARGDASDNSYLSARRR